MLYTSATRNAGVAAIVALANGGTLRLRDGTTTVCDIPLEATAFDATGGVATARGADGTNPIGGGNPLSAAASAAGDVDNYQVLNSSATVIWSGDADELTLNNTNIANGQTVTITSWTHTLPAGS